jgi:tRNA A37 methylthiotransferase MiaB
LLEDDVPQSLKQKRKNELNELLKQMAQRSNQGMVGTTQIVLLDRIDPRSKELIGRTANFKQTRIAGLTDAEYLGKFINVEITACTPWALRGVKAR